MEKDDEIKNITGSSYDFGARIYDPRIGRWLAIDPASHKYPFSSPYVFALNNPLFYVDPNGEDVYAAPEDIKYTGTSTPKSTSDLGEATLIGARAVLSPSGEYDIEFKVNIVLSSVLEGPTVFNQNNPGKAEHVLTHEKQHVAQWEEAFNKPIEIVLRGTQYVGTIDEIANKVFNAENAKLENREFSSLEEIDEAEQHINDLVNEAVDLAVDKVKEGRKQDMTKDNQGLSLSELDAMNRTAKIYKSNGEAEPPAAKFSDNDAELVPEKKP